MNYRAGAKQGFTLVEVLVAVALIIILLTLVFYPILSAYGYIQKIRDIRTQARY
jgi:prepilin-type N-terminal cleavage/methylation domain-containing protein